jgi:hypothetical protein
MSKAMYDSVGFWLPWYLVGPNDQGNLPYCLTGGGEHYFKDGSSAYSGTFGDNYNVYVNEAGVSLKGSLAKYYLGDNLQTLTRADTAFAIEKMADELCLPIHKANVNRIDFACNFIMKYGPDVYYPYFADCKGYQRFEKPHSVYWENQKMTKLLYNKIAECKSKRVAIPDVMHGQNVLRYEIRLKRRLKTSLKMEAIQACTLSDEQFYLKMVDRYIEEYEAITKVHTLHPNYNDMSSPKDYWTFKAVQKIFEDGGPQKALEEVERMRAMEAFSSPEYYSRLKREIKERCQSPKFTTSSEFTDELDKKVRRIGMYSR